VKNLSIPRKLFIFSAAQLAVLVAVAALALFENHQLSKSVKDFHKTFQRYSLIRQVQEEFDRARLATLSFQISRNSGDLQDAIGELDKIQSLREKVATTPMPQADRDSLVQVLDRIAALRDTLGTARQTNSLSGTAAYREDLAPLGRQISDLLDALKNGAQADAATEAAIQDEATAFIPKVLIAGTVLGVLAGLIIAYVFGRSLGNPIARVVEAIRKIQNREYDVAISDSDRGDELGEIARNLTDLRDQLSKADEARKADDRKVARQRVLFGKLREGLGQMSQGDLATRIDASQFTDLDDTYVVLCHDFNALAESLVELISSVRSSSDTVQGGAAEIAQVAQDLSKRTETQAATLEQSAAALEQLTSSVKSAAEKAGEADKAVADNRREAEASGEIVNSAIEAMHHIEESSSQITQIIGVIDDIAFQTNLLALNAGVEAARAGEAGRGFAVVASEVRALAQRASESAREIKELISKSVNQVEEGGRLVGKTGTALEEIVQRVAQVAGLVSEIASSAKEQSIGLQEINAGVNELDQVAQHNAAMVEETTASSQQLSTEAQRLTEVLARFSGIRSGSGSAEVLPLNVPDARPATETPPAPKLAAAAGGGGEAAAEGWHEF